MSLDTYTNLKAYIANNLSRTDLTAEIVDAIALAEAKMQRQLRAQDMETKTAAFSITSEYMAVPADYLEVRSFSIQASPRRALTYLSDELMDSTDASTGNVKFFNSSGGYFRFAPAPSGTFTATLNYYAKITPLATTSPNWILTKHPDLYVYGTMLELVAGKIQADPTQISLWKAGWDETIALIQKHNNHNRYSGQGMAVRLA